MQSNAGSEDDALEGNEQAGQLREVNGMQGSRGIIEIQLCELKLDNVDVIEPLALQLQVSSFFARKLHELLCKIQRQSKWVQASNVCRCAEIKASCVFADKYEENVIWDDCCTRILSSDSKDKIPIKNAIQNRQIWADLRRLMHSLLTLIQSL